MTFKFGNLGDFKFIFENISGYETRSQMGEIDEKTEVKNLVQVYL
jgi:hypothetical protein